MMRSIALAVCMLLASCGTLQNRYDVDRVSPDQLTAATAMVILSAGAPDECVSFSTFLRLKQADRTYRSLGEVALLPVDPYSTRSDFETHQGNLHAIVLPAGNYYFAPWLANPYFTMSNIPKMEFSVAPGEIVYLGEYFQGARCAPGNNVEIRDQRARDLALFASRNPNFDLSNVQVRLLTLSPLPAEMQ